MKAWPSTIGLKGFHKENDAFICKDFLPYVNPFVRMLVQWLGIQTDSTGFENGLLRCQNVGCLRGTRFLNAISFSKGIYRVIKKSLCT